jgi:hypothetical protein
VEALKNLSGPVFKPAPFLLALLALVSCGGEGSKGTVGGTLPGCAQAGTAVELPTGLAGVPLPGGAVIDHTRQDAAGNTVYGGYIPGDVKATRDYFEQELPKHGYTVGEGDSEDHEAEMDFDGHGVEARLKLHDIDSCDGALTVEAAITKGSE